MHALQIRETTFTSLGLRSLEEELRQRRHPSGVRVFVVSTDWQPILPATGLCGEAPDII